MYMPLFVAHLLSFVILSPLLEILIVYNIIVHLLLDCQSEVNRVIIITINKILLN